MRPAETMGSREQLFHPDISYIRLQELDISAPAVTLGTKRGGPVAIYALARADCPEQSWSSSGWRAKN